MDAIDLLGLAAACLTTGCLVPQAIQTWRTRSAKDLNLKMFLMMTAGAVLWLVFGILRGEIAIIAANAAALLLSSAILFFKLRFG
jgi:MtN3 and saliva related transmembrane protein